MNIILLSGGSGKRLWPLSNDVRSKQFIRLFKNENGSYESMAQRVYRKLRTADTGGRIVIATARSQVSAIHNQLGEETDICAEPCRRDTFPAIALAAAYLHEIRGVRREEAIVVCPVDPYVEDDYFAALKRIGELAGQGKENLVLMGIEPTYPSEKYGYIIPCTANEVSEVREFREKPDLMTARAYMAAHALWNGGVFGFRLGYILDRAADLLGCSRYEELYARYDSFPKISFDYAVAEKEKRIRVMRFAGQWKDLGTWNTLTEAMEEAAVGKAVMNGTCENVHVINELNVPILAMGLKNVVISASPQGVLVSDKEQSSYIRPFVDAIDQTVMFAEKSWGSYRVIDVEAESMTVLVTLLPGHGMNYHSHRYRDEVWTVIAGSGRTVLDGIMKPVTAGDIVQMKAGCRHTVIADTELRLVEVQLGREISVQDKEKHRLEIRTVQSKNRKEIICKTKVSV